MKMLSLLGKSLILVSLVPIVGSLYAAESSLTAFRGEGERGDWGGERGREEAHPEGSYYSQHPMDKPYNQGEVQGLERGAEYSNNQGESPVYVLPEQNDPFEFPQPY
jgi:hypothetical protein